jgi:transcriptional regulator with GAF, ATPase, and Fis domain
VRQQLRLGVETEVPMPERARAATERSPSADRGVVDVNELAEQLGRLARSLEAEDDTAAMLDDVVAAAVTLIPGAEDASISLVVARRQIVSPHRSGELPGLVDAIQTETAQGPCMDAAYEHQTVRVPDMRHEQRWPRFARRAYEAGAGSMLSFQLYVQGDTLGALNLYNRARNGFDEESEQVGRLFASHAAVAFAAAQKVDHLDRAVASRDVIGQAKGMLMERYRLDADGAFRVLTRVSQSTNRPLRDVARELVTTGRLAVLQDLPLPT